MHGANVALRATDQGFLEHVRGYLNPLRLPQKPDRFLMFSADCGVRKVLPGGSEIRGRVRLYMNTLLVYSGTMDDEAAGRFISLLRDIDTSNSNEFVRIRATGVTVADGDAIIFPSDGHPQLPTLAATLVRAGADYLGDEVVSLDPVLDRIHPQGMPLLLDAGDLDRFPELGRPASKRRPTAGANTVRRPVLPGELGGQVGRPTTLGRVLFPDFRPGEATTIEPAASSESLFALSRATLNLHVWGDRSLLLYQRLLQRVEVARLVIGDLDAAKRIVMDGYPGNGKGVTP